MTQIFKQPVPNNILFDLLEKTCQLSNGYYILNKTSFKIATLNNLIEPFYNNISNYYHNSKKHYLNQTNYNRFITVLRQICNKNNITYSSKMIYNKSTYDIHYFILSPHETTFPEPFVSKIKRTDKENT